MFCYVARQKHWQQTLPSSSPTVARHQIQIPDANTDANTDAHTDGNTETKTSATGIAQIFPNCYRASLIMLLIQVALKINETRPD